jgi:protein-S-isoprenylcysteine O-methyltransferase Ste14
VTAIRSLITPAGALRRRLDQSTIYDWAMRCPLIVYSSFILFRDVSGFCHQAAQDPLLFSHFDVNIALAFLARISQWMFVVLLSIQPLFRLRAIAKSDAILPRFGALAAVSVPLLFMLLERAPPSVAFNLLAVIISLLANVMALVTASFLGRSLSVMPEARRLVQSGPYGAVRHPLYFCELIGTAAVFLQYRSWPATALLLLAIVLLVRRAGWEEAVLARTFPEFAAYRARTSFLVPADPLRFFASFLTQRVARRRLAFVVVIMIAVLTPIVALPWKLFV